MLYLEHYSAVCALPSGRGYAVLSEDVCLCGPRSDIVQIVQLRASARGLGTVICLCATRQDAEFVVDCFSVLTQHTDDPKRILARKMKVKRFDNFPFPCDGANVAAERSCYCDPMTLLPDPGFVRPPPNPVCPAAPGSKALTKVDFKAGSKFSRILLPYGIFRNPETGAWCIVGRAGCFCEVGCLLEGTFIHEQTCDWFVIPRSAAPTGEQKA